MASLKPKSKINERQLALRSQLWPDVGQADLWAKEGAGYTYVPRTMPLIMAIIDDMTKGTPAGSTYFELFSRVFEDGIATLNKPKEMAYHAGLTGQRAERTWNDRLSRLNDLGFIKLAAGSSGKYSYALIMNPYHVIHGHSRKHSGVTKDSYNSLLARVAEIGAKDLNSILFEEQESAKNSAKKGTIKRGAAVPKKATKRR